MRLLTLVAAVAASLPAVVAATGYATVVNNCSFPVYVWSVDPSSVGTQHTLNPDATPYSETYRGAGIVLKVSREPGESALYDPSVPLTQFQYTLDGSTVYYALADTRGDPFLGNWVSLDSSDDACSDVSWEDGSGPSTVYTCGSSSNLALSLCN